MARASGRDIAELFGYAPDDQSNRARTVALTSQCPFFDRTCSKTDHSGEVVFGVCSVTKGSASPPIEDVVVCPERLYVGDYELLRIVADDVWGSDGGLPFIIGGDLHRLSRLALAEEECVVAFGQRSGAEISAGNMSMDWVLQRYRRASGELQPNGIVGIEVQSIDTTGNYRAPWSAYRQAHEGRAVTEIPNSGHGLNWANVHKRLIPQLIRKGNIYSKIAATQGFYFLTPRPVFDKFEDVLGNVDHVQGPSRETLSIRTAALGEPKPEGAIRDLLWESAVHIPLAEVSRAFISHVPDSAVSDMEARLSRLLS